MILQVNSDNQIRQAVSADIRIQKFSLIRDQETRLSFKQVLTKIVLVTIQKIKR